MSIARNLMTSVAFCLVLAIGSVASAGPLFTFGVGQPVNQSGPDNATYGNEFTVGATALNVSHLGAFIAPGFRDGNGNLTRAYVAQLFENSVANPSTFLGEVTIPIGTAVDADGFAYAPYVTTLAAGINYVLTDYGIPSGSVFGDPVETPMSYGTPSIPAGTFDSAVSFVMNRYGVPYTVGSQAFPAGNNSGHFQFMGGNLLFSPVPEPASFALAGLGVGC